MDHEDRRIIAVCTSLEDAKIPNLVMACLIQAAEARNYLPLCVAFDRNGVEVRRESVYPHRLHGGLVRVHSFDRAQYVTGRSDTS